MEQLYRGDLCTETLANAVNAPVKSDILFIFRGLEIPRDVSACFRYLFICVTPRWQHKIQPCYALRFCRQSATTPNELIMLYVGTDLQYKNELDCSHISGYFKSTTFLLLRLLKLSIYSFFKSIRYGWWPYIYFEVSVTSLISIRVAILFKVSQNIN